MAYVASNNSVSVGSDRALGLWAQLSAALARRRLYHRTVAELNRLTDRELADLAISRSDIPAVAREATKGN